MKTYLAAAIAALSLTAGCYKTNYVLNGAGGGTPSQTHDDKMHWSIIGFVELSKPVDVPAACGGAQPASIKEEVSLVGGLVNLALGTVVPILSVHNTTVNCAL